MTTIREALKQYEADNMFVKISRAVKLEKDLNDIAKKDARFEFFNYLLKRKIKGRFLFPEYVFNLCDILSIVTLNDLDTWLNASKSNILVDILDPVIKFDLQETVSNQDITKMVSEHATLETDCTWDYGDAHYKLINEKELKQILEECPINHRKYITETFDCEDFAQTTKCWLKIHEIENIAFGFAEVNFYKAGKLAFAHGINIVPLREGKVVCVEPQTDAIWSADKPEFSFHADAMKFRFIQF